MKCGYLFPFSVEHGRGKESLPLEHVSMKNLLDMNVSVESLSTVP